MAITRRYNPDGVSDQIAGRYPLRLIRLCLQELYRLLGLTDQTTATIPGSPSVVLPHKVLSATHTDTVPQAVVRGSLVYGNTTPLWDRLPAGTVGTFLGSDGTDVSYLLVVAGYPTFGINLAGQAYSP